jgi:hypothetical protein
MGQKLKVTNYFKKVKSTTWYILSALIFVPIFTTIVGEWGKDQWKFITSTFDYWMWVTVWWGLAVALVVGIVALMAWIYKCDLEQQIEQKDRLIKLDTNLFNILMLLGETDKAAAKESIIKEFFQECCAACGNKIHRAMIVMPNGDYLLPKYHQGFSDSSIQKVKFSIKENDPAGGVCAKAYKSKATQIVRIDRLKDGTYKADDPDFQIFIIGKKNLPYESFVSVPMIHKRGHESVCIGVLNIDSPDRDAFDGLDEILRRISERATCILVSCNGLHEDLPSH